MANFVFNIAKGRVAELYNRVDTNDPAASALIVVVLESSGLEAQSVLEDVDTVTALVAGTTNEQTTMGRKTLDDTVLSAMTPDDTNNRMDLDTPDIVWTGATGNAVGALVFCYDNDTGAGTDANIVPLTYHDFAVTPDGSDITAQVAVFFRAT